MGHGVFNWKLYNGSVPVVQCLLLGHVECGTTDMEMQRVVFLFWPIAMPCHCMHGFTFTHILFVCFVLRERERERERERDLTTGHGLMQSHSVAIRGLF